MSRLSRTTKSLDSILMRMDQDKIDKVGVENAIADARHMVRENKIRSTQGKVTATSLIAAAAGGIMFGRGDKRVGAALLALGALGGGAGIANASKERAKNSKRRSVNYMSSVRY